METNNSNEKLVQILARDHIDIDGSVVRSGMALAEAVLKAMENEGRAEVNLEGIKGASSSYFNVFLRRIDEGCGLVVFEDRVRLQFASNVQKMVYTRSFESMKRGTSNSLAHSDQDAVQDGRSKLSRILAEILSFFR
jgi:hypothetical protein